jgi:hypothetical protein
MTKNPNYDNVIIGSGIAGLTVFYYLAETTKTRNLVITNNLASQATSKFPLGPRFLHKDKDTEALLRRLKFPTKTREVFIGYKHNEEIRNYPTDDFKLEYAKKSRGTDKVEGSFLSGGGKPGFTAFEVGQPELAKEIFDRCVVISKESKFNSIVVENIKSIDFKKITTDKKVYYANNIISTIPLPVLLKLVSNFSISFKIESVPEEVNFFLTSEIGRGQFDYIYSITDSWHRKTYAPELDKWVYEVRPESLGKFENEFKDKILDKVTMKSQISNSLNLKELGRIKLVGRYAQLNHSIKTEDVVKWAYSWTHKFQKRK